MNTQTLCALVLSFFLLVLPTSINAQRNHTDTLEWNGGHEEYIIHLPSRYDPARDYPLVLVLHGGGGNHTFTMLYTGFNKVANKNDFIVVYPRGSKTGTNLAGKDAFHWADGRGTTPPDIDGIDHVDLIRQILIKISTEYSVNEKRVYACGISNGAFMAQRLACELSDKIVAVASVAATFPEDLLETCSPSNGISVMFINGTKDNFVPTEMGGEYNGESEMKGYGGRVLSTKDAIDHWLKVNKCSSQAQTYPLPNSNKKDRSQVVSSSYSKCNRDAEILYYKIIGGGHTWPKATIQVPLTGVTNKDINGSEEIWKFFSKQSRE